MGLKFKSVYFLLLLVFVQCQDEGEEEEEFSFDDATKFDDMEEDDEANNSEETDFGDNLEIPDSLNWKEKGLYPTAVNQGPCNICGYVSGVQALCSRAAITSGNFVVWSIQNFITCDHYGEKFCTGAQPTKMVKLLEKNPDWAVSENSHPFLKNCGRPECYQCIREGNSRGKPLLKDVQWWFGAGTRNARSQETAIKAIQFGPLTTCFDRLSASTLEKMANNCERGCEHANAIIGYDKDYWYLQENFGPKIKYPAKKWIKKLEYQGLNKSDGTWFVKRNGTCAEALLNKAFYSLLFYDYDRGNAYFTEAEHDKDLLDFISTSSSIVQKEDFRNVGLAKRRCSLLGVLCEGYVEFLNSTVALIKSIRDSDGASSTTEKITIYKKTQMVVYLRHSSGVYISLSDNNGLPCIGVTEDRRYAAPFFTSDKRFISFDYPGHVLSGSVMKPHNVDSPDAIHQWTLKDTVLQNLQSNLSLGIRDTNVVAGVETNLEDPFQRYDIEMSGSFFIKSLATGKLIGIPLSWKKKGMMLEKLEENALRARWQGRQIISQTGKPFLSNWTLSTRDFKMHDQDKYVSPIDTHLYQESEVKPYLGYSIESKELAMFAEPSSPEGETRWAFEYDDL